MTQRNALIVIFASMLVIGAGYASAFLPGGTPPMATYAFAIATAAVMVAMIVLGAARASSALGPLRWVFAFIFALLATGFCVALGQPNSASGKLWLGLPSGAAIILYVVGVIPLVVLPLAYALSFNKTMFDEGELEEIRRKLRELDVEDVHSHTVDTIEVAG